MGQVGQVGRAGRLGFVGRIVLITAMFFSPTLSDLPDLPGLPDLRDLPGLPMTVHAQHAAFRLKGRVTNERGQPISNADVRLEAVFGYAAGTFSGPRLLSAQTNAKGEWNV